MSSLILHRVARTLAPAACALAVGAALVAAPRRASANPDAPTPRAAAPDRVPESVLEAAYPPPHHRVAIEFVSGMAVAAVVVPGAMLLGAELGTLSPNLVGAALPPVLLLALVPPFAITGIESLVAERLRPGAGHFSPAIFSAIGLQAGTMVAAAFAGVWALDVRSLVLFSVVEALALPAVITATMYGTESRPPRPRHAATSRPEPGHAPASPPSSALVPEPPARGTFTVPVVAFAF